MKQLSFLPLLFLLLVPSASSAQKAIMRLTDPTLMHEVRATPSPLNGERINMNPPRFMWPDKFPHLGPVLDGVDDCHTKQSATYRIRIADDKDFTRNVITAERDWAFFNPFTHFAPGTYYWQHAYVAPDGSEEWSPVYHFTVDSSALDFNPPSYTELLKSLPTYHPRTMLDGKQWDQIIERNKNNPEALSFISTADERMSHHLRHLAEEIDTTFLVNLTNSVQYKAALIRESRKIVDREEKTVESMVRAYLLTRNPIYYKAAMTRLTEILSWKGSKYFAGDFNVGTILSMSTSAYDAFHDLLTPEEKALLLNSIQENGNLFFHEFVNHLENRIADNHVWQMTFRILTMAAFATYGDIPEAVTWTDYCYNMWVSRFPGLNEDGGWHNGDSYFHVNIRTLIEVPAFYSRITGFDFFQDPWYNNNALYVIYEQPPFSKSGGQGNSHENQRSPSGARVGYADALARQCANPWAAAYVNYIKEREPKIFTRSFEAKPADLTWYRCITDKSFPETTETLADLPSTHVFNETGLGLMHTTLGDYKNNAMLSFRSSPYGGTSHALANQNAFNTFYGGKEIFYSSGHRTGFTDDHCMYSYRNTRAHNSILVNGMGQTIGTEGYGWMPRWYEGEQLSYFVGDASNAYGEVTAPLWLTRGRLSGTEYTPANGWDINRLDRFRRHVIQLGNTGLFVLYDELLGKEDVTWSYLLHTTTNPMQIERKSADALTITGTNKVGGTSVAHLYSSSAVEDQMTDQFFSPPTNWKNVTDAKGKALKYADHWHFSATTPKVDTARFLTIIDTHGKERTDLPVTRKGDTWYVGDWVIKCNLTPKGKAKIEVKNAKANASLLYDESKNDGATIVNDVVNGKKVKEKLVDIRPKLEI